MRRLGFLIFLVLLSGCEGSRHHNHAAKADPNVGPATLIYSPNGEPLNGGPLGRPTCTAAMSLWFDRVDANHDGVISKDEFMADAKAQFHRMDIDNKGVLVSEEIERFRLPYRQQPSTETPPEQNNGDDATSQEGQHRHGHGGKGGGDQGGGSARSNANDAIDPVMTADVNNDFKVTPDEFMTYAGNVFTQLDTAHNSLLDRKEALAFCGKPDAK